MKPSEMASYQNLGGKPVKNVQIEPQTTEIWQKQAKRPVSERVCDTYVIKLLKIKTL